MTTRREDNKIIFDSAGEAHLAEQLMLRAPDLDLLLGALDIGAAVHRLLQSDSVFPGRTDLMATMCKLVVAMKPYHITQGRPRHAADN